MFSSRKRKRSWVKKFLLSWVCFKVFRSATRGSRPSSGGSLQAEFEHQRRRTSGEEHSVKTAAHGSFKTSAFRGGRLHDRANSPCWIDASLFTGQKLTRYTRYTRYLHSEPIWTEKPNRRLRCFGLHWYSGCSGMHRHSFASINLPKSELFQRTVEPCQELFKIKALCTQERERLFASVISNVPQN